MSEDINNLLGMMPKGQMSSNRPAYSSHGNFPSMGHPFFGYCEPPVRQHAVYASASKPDFRKNAWPAAATPPDSLTAMPLDCTQQQHQHRASTGAAVAVKSGVPASTSGTSPAMPPQPLPQLPPTQPAAADPYYCYKSAVAAGWDPYMPGAVRRGPSAAGHPHPHHLPHCYAPGAAGGMVPLAHCAAARPPLAPRHPAGSSAAQAPSRPASQAHGNVTFHHHPHQQQQASPSSQPLPAGGHDGGSAAMPFPPPPGAPPAVWPWPWPQAQPLPPLQSQLSAAPLPPSGATSTAPAASASAPTSGGSGSSSGDVAWTSVNGGSSAGGAAVGGSGGGGRNGWRGDEQDEAEDALQELLLEEIAAAPWPPVHIPALRAAGICFENYRCDPAAMYMPWPAGVPPPLQAAMGSPWPPPPSAKQAAAAAAAWESMSSMAPPVPALLQQQLSSSPSVPSLAPQLPPQPKHMISQQLQSHGSQQQQGAAEADPGMLQQPPLHHHIPLGGSSGMMDVDPLTASAARNDDVFFAAWLNDMSVAPPGYVAAAAAVGLTGGAAGSWPPPGVPLGPAHVAAAPPPHVQDGGYNRASFVNSPTSASMPTTPTMTTGRPRAETACGGGGAGSFALPAAVSEAAAAAPSSQNAAAAAAAAAVAVVAVVEAAADAADAAAAAACGGDANIRIDEADGLSDDGEGEIAAADLNGPGGAAAAGSLTHSTISAAAAGEGGGAGAHAAGLREHIYRTFDLPVADAARFLGISATELKRRCRRLGISRWPQRKLQSLRRIVQAAETDATLSEEERKAVIELAARNREEIMADPDAPLVDLLKTVRQTQYKQSFEKRAAAAAASRRSSAAI